MENHVEFEAVVAEVYPWGAVVRSVDGEEIVIDLVKLDFATVSVGDTMLCVVIDAKRGRASTLSGDFEIASKFRSGELQVSDEDKRLEWLSEQISRMTVEERESSPEVIEVRRILTDRSKQ